MDVVCSICFQPGELYQVPGYSLPTCLKCSEQLANKGLTFYQQTTRPSDQMQQTNATITIMTTQSPPTQQHQPQQTATQSNGTANNANGSNAESQQVNIQHIKKEVNIFELEQTLMNMESEYLFGDDGSCPLCTKTFTRRASLLNHIRNHSAERKYVCNYCQKGFTQAANLRNHERIHTNERPYVCIDCGKAFTQITNLNNHRRLHTGERPFVCIEPDCGRSFAQVTNLNNHMKTHHKIQQYVCNQCPRKFTQVTQLNLHLTSHTGIREFFCPQCPNKSFKQQSHLLQHLKIHGTDIGYPCTKCDEKFLQLSHLEHHMKMHDSFKYKCEMCPSSFNQETLLKKHIQRHIDGRYLMCPIVGCSEGFTIKHQLTKHLHMQHAGESNLPTKRSTSSKRAAANNENKNACNYENCNASFADIQHLHEHVRVLHQGGSGGGQATMKNAGKKSKVDNMMLLEQLKNARENNTVESTALGQSFNFLLANGAQFLGNAEHMDPNSVHHKRILSVAEIIDLTEQAKKAAAAHAANGNIVQKVTYTCAMCAIQFSTEEDLRQHNFFKHPEKKNVGQIGGGVNISVSGMQVIDGNAGGCVAGAPSPTAPSLSHQQILPTSKAQQQQQQQHHQHQQNHLLLQQHQQHHTNNSEIIRSIYLKSEGRLTCPFCFNVFKSQSRLARHIGKFHS